MNTTTFQTIKGTTYANVMALTPSGVAHIKYQRHPLEGTIPLREWAPQNGAAACRVFEMRVEGEESDPPVMDPAARFVQVEAVLEMAYPVMPAIYDPQSLDDTTVGMLSIEDAIAQDMAKLRDKIFSPASYVSGQQEADVRILPPDRSDPNVWYGRLAIRFLFGKSQTL